MKSLKLLISAVGLFLAFVIFYSCKKTSTTENLVAESKEQNDLLQIYREKLKDKPLVSTQLLNLPGKGYYGDIRGNKITVITPPGENEASSCPIPGDSEFWQVFVSMEREYTCGVGYRFLVTYKVTSEFYPVMSISPSQLSTGRVRLRNSAGSVIYVTPQAPLLSITNNGVVGTNSFGADLNEFIIKYRTGIVSSANYNAATYIDPNLFAYTDCANYPTITIPFSPQQSAIGSQHNTQPCLRIDKVGWNPSTGTPPNYSPPNLYGADPLFAGCTPGYVYPDKQEIQFLNGSGQWKYFYLYINGMANPSVETGLINYWNIYYIDLSKNGLVPGNVQVRYRNNHMGVNTNGGPCVTQPADTWITETWFLN